MMETEVRENGATYRRAFYLNRDRYHYDCGGLSEGWRQYDTKQDAWYFGVWVNVQERKILTWAEGDETLVSCPDEESFRAEMKELEDFHGPPPPSAKAIDMTTGEVTAFYDERPSLDQPEPERSALARAIEGEMR